MIWISLNKKNEENKPIKNAWYDWLINYTPEPITKIVGDFKDKIISLFNTKTPKETAYGTGKKIGKQHKTKLEILLY